MGSQRTIQNVHVIVNPASGYGGKGRLLPDFRAAAADAGLELTEHVTTGPEDATHYARRLADQADAIVVWGGDGTVNETVNGLAGSDTPMLPVPAGTENLLAKELRCPSHPAKIVDVLRAGIAAQCDVGLANGRVFMSIIGIGFDGEVVRRLSMVRSGHISHLTYFWPIWRTFWEHDFPRMKVIADGEVVFDDYGLAFIGNISRYAVGLRICSEAEFDDGMLDLVVFHCHQQSTLVLQAAWTLLRRHPLKGNVLYRRFRNVRFETAEPVPSQVDGDVGPDTPLDVRLHEKRISVLVPPHRPNWELWPWTGEIA